MSNFTSPPSDPILFLFPRLSLCHSWSRRARAPLPLLLPSYRSHSISFFSFLWPSLSLDRFIVSSSTLLVSRSLFLRTLAPFTRSLVPSPRGEDAIFSWPLFFHGLRHPSLFLLSSTLLSAQLSFPILSSLPLSLSTARALRFLGSLDGKLSTLSLSPLFLSLYYTRRFLFLLVGARFTFFQRYRRSSSALLGLFPFVVPSYHRTVVHTVILETTNQLFLWENVSGNGFSPPA